MKIREKYFFRLILVFVVEWVYGKIIEKVAIKKLRNYIRMKKIFSAVFSLYLLMGMTILTSARTSIAPIATSTQTCVKDAIEKRESALLASFDAYSTTVKMVFAERKNNLKIAWDNQTMKEIKATVKQVWSVFRRSQKDNRDKLRAEIKSVWRIFRTDIKLCGETAVSTDATNESVDNNL